jgi:hypothetical protein
MAQPSMAMIQGARTAAHCSIKLAACCLLLAGQVFAQTGANAPQPATSAPAAPSQHPRTEAPGPALTLYRKLASVGLDPKAVYHVRDVSLDREDLHVTLEDGTIGFLQDVDGRVTGAFFQGDGDLLLVPPNLAERASLNLFTGAAVLEEKFATAYLRFNDDTAAQMHDALRPADDPAGFVAQWDATCRTLAEADALRLMASFSNAPPANGRDVMLRLRLQGTKLGVFDVYFDTLSAEQIAALKLSYGESGALYYDVLTSFPMRSARMGERSGEEERSLVESTGTLNRLRIRSYKIQARVTPPQELAADAELDVDVRQGGDRLVFFELSRALKLSGVESGGQPVEFLQNEAIEGSALARRGNDVVAVLFPQRLRAGQELHLKFSYAGNVLSDAGGGLLYVGARGIWYPNRGMAMADFDLQFRYPPGWTLVATGKRVENSTQGGDQLTRWVSERPMPLAGFNLGKYETDTVRAGDVVVETFATTGVENTFARRQAAVALPPVIVPPPTKSDVPPPPLPAATPTPAHHALAVADTAARAIDYFSQHFGPYPYGTLALTQMPGSYAQGWPGLVYLSSYAWLTPAELAQTRFSRFQQLVFDQFMTVHETAHQWWGDLVGWKSYRDQWLVEALANYSAVLALEKSRPEDCKRFLEYYRLHLLAKNSRGEENASAGPVTLGLRLTSSHFPDGFLIVSYGRGTWLMHMLRTMLRDAAALSGHPGDDPFLRVLLRLRDRYQGREVSTREFQAMVEEELPDSLRYEGRKSLDWFFDQWVNGTAIPHLELKDARIVRKTRTATAVLLQKDAPEQLVTSVPVYADTPAGLVLVARVFADGPESRIRLHIPENTRKLVLDPDNTVLTR